MGATKATAEKTSGSASVMRAKAPARPFFARAGGGFFPPVQAKMTVGQPGDKFEQEADRTADRVMRMPDPAPAGKLQRQPADKTQRQPATKLQRQPTEKVQRREEEKILRAATGEGIQAAHDHAIRRREEERILRATAADGEVRRAEHKDVQASAEPHVQKAEAHVARPHREEEKILRVADDTLHKKDDEVRKAAHAGGDDLQRDAAPGGQVPAVEDHVQSAIQRRMTGGEPLANDVRSHMEPRFEADFGRVRVHRDGEAAALSNRLGARAFTYQNHIFFSRGQYQPDTGEGRHLLAHELTHTIQQGHAVQRSPQQPISAAPATPTVQRWGVQSALDHFADWAYAIPGFRLLTVVLGFNPINMRSTARTAANILRGLIELMPGGSLITRALDNYGIVNKAASWVESKLAQLGDIGSWLKQALDDFLDSLSWRDIFHLGDVWDRAKRIFTEPIERLINFAIDTVVDLLRIVKDAILRPLAALAKGTRGYDLLCVLLGRDPITGDPVAATADNLIGGFMKLIGQEEIWENIKKGHAVARALAWFHKALSGLMVMVRAIPGRILDTFASLTFQDIVTLAGAFGKIAGAFAHIAIDFIHWGLGTIWDLLEIIFDVVKPGLMKYVKRTGAALKSILKNPMPFLRNLVRAAKLGFTQFVAHFGTHLKKSLIEWLTGSLKGVYIPKAATLLELGKFALSVLGITWAQIRAKIVAALGPNGERIMQGLELAFDVVKALVTGGIAAVWNLIKEKLADLKEQVIGAIVSFVTETIVKKAIPKIVAMFIPGAGFIPAIISIYDTVMVFVHKIAKIIQVVTAFINSIVAIASGHIGAAAKRVESALEGALTLAISFLAGLLGLSKISDKIMEVVQKIRAKVDAAIGAAVNWVVGKARAMFARLFSGDGPDSRTEEQKTSDKKAAIAEAEQLVLEDSFDEGSVRTRLGPIKSKYRLSSLSLVVDAKNDQIETIHFTAAASPEEAGNPKTVRRGPSGPVTPVPVNGWILNKSAGNRYEQVTASVSASTRVNGVTVPRNFMTAIPGGGTNMLSYATEGSSWERTDFVHKSRFVAPTRGGAFRLQPPVGRDGIRTRFYEDSTSIHDAIKNGRKASLMVNATYFLSEGDSAREQRFGYKLDPATGLAMVPWVDSSADHQPPVADHWTNGGGNNTNQSSRKAWTSNPSTYKIMSGRLNSSLGSRGERYTQEVGINFRGPGDPA